MMVREAKLLVGVCLITLLHACFLSICVVSENQSCRPSSCGDIRNISYPFRLKGDLSHCGDPDPAYELACENNRTILFGKYYVVDINYHESTIRVVVPGLEKGNCFSAPLYSLITYDLYPYQYPPAGNTTVLMKCTRPINDHNYIPIVPCNSTKSNSSTSQTYAYALVYYYQELTYPYTPAKKHYQARDLPDGCTFGVTVVTGQWKAVSKPGNLSSSDLQEMLLMGLEISFLRSHEYSRKGLDCHANFTGNNIRCYYYRPYEKNCEC